MDPIVEYVLAFITQKISKGFFDPPHLTPTPASDTRSMSLENLGFCGLCLRGP